MENNFSKWFMDTWNATGGIICQSDAADLLNVKRQSIRTRIISGSLKSYEYENSDGKKKVYVSLKEIAMLKLKKG